MNISQTPFLPDIRSDESIPEGRLAYLQERTRNRIFEYVLEKFLAAETAGLSKAKLARRLHKRPDIITRLLGSPGNWTIGTISDLLAGIANEELEPASLSVVDRATRNNVGPDWLRHRAASSDPITMMTPQPAATGTTSHFAAFEPA